MAFLICEKCGKIYWRGGKGKHENWKDSFCSLKCTKTTFETVESVNKNVRRIHKRYMNLARIESLIWGFCMVAIFSALTPLESLSIILGAIPYGLFYVFSRRGKIVKWFKIAQIGMFVSAGVLIVTLILGFTIGFFSDAGSAISDAVSAQ